jgi:stearoyl-CoA desaturase (delta-9 desaturase)
VTARDVVLAIALYAITGHGVTVGYHRLFTHRSFTANRPLKIALGVAGAMAVEGSIISWVANHRRHHMFSDQPGDPHSPNRYGAGAGAQLRGLAYAHVGWLFAVDGTSAERYAPDLLGDRDVVAMSRRFPAFAVASFVLPSAAGWLLSGSPRWRYCTDLGGRRAGRSAAPRDMERQLRVPHVRSPTVGRA